MDSCLAHRWVPHFQSIISPRNVLNTMRCSFTWWRQFDIIMTSLDDHVLRRKYIQWNTHMWQPGYDNIDKKNRIHHWCSVGTGKSQPKCLTSFPLGGWARGIGIFLFPLNTNYGFFFSHSLYLAIYCIFFFDVTELMKHSLQIFKRDAGKVSPFYYEKCHNNSVNGILSNEHVVISSG